MVTHIDKRHSLPPRRACDWEQVNRRDEMTPGHTSAVRTAGACFAFMHLSLSSCTQRQFNRALGRSSLKRSRSDPAKLGDLGRPGVCRQIGCWIAIRSMACWIAIRSLAANSALMVHAFHLA
jgi:hypothetical protein